MVGNLDDVKSSGFWKALLAELLGTCLLVFIGCGSCTTWGEGKEPTMVQVSLCFGLSVATIAWSIANVSGGHINPAVTVGMLLTRKISIVRAVGYILVQCVGAVIGSAILYGLTATEVRGPMGSTRPNPMLTKPQAFGVELMITFILVFTVFATCDKNRKDLNGSGPLAIGLSVTMCHLFAIRYTGSSMNPARSFGPAVVTGRWDNHWIYWCGPVLGGLIASLLYDNLFAANASLAKARSYMMSKEYTDEDFFPESQRKINEAHSMDDL